jgi:geranylgeranyl diphosphate synthase type II
MSGTQARNLVIRQEMSGQLVRARWLDDGTHDKALDQTIGRLKSRINARLQALLETADEAPQNLVSAMRHALLGGGKRFRPLIFVLTVSGTDSVDAAIDIGCAVEMVHTASLILDDLPCMDDADLRRDKPTTHKVFGQATAILAAISLLTLGLRILTTVGGVSDQARARMGAVLCHAVGHTGLAAGQEIDLSHPHAMAVDVEQKNWLKTGKLFAAMAEMATILSDRPPHQAEALTAFAFHVGSAFQALDDLLDAIVGSNVLGKDSGQDAERSTMANERGLPATRQSYIFHLDAANRTLPRCGVEEAPIRFMLRSIHMLVPQEIAASPEVDIVAL